MTKKRITKKIQSPFSTAACFGIALLAASGEISAADNLDGQMAPAQADRSYSFSEAVAESVTGDVYSDAAAANWQDLSYSNLFSEGWDKPWVSPPNGGAVRHVRVG